MTIAMIPADNIGNKIYIKDLRIAEDKKVFVMFRSTYNDMPFIEVELGSVDSGKNCAIFGDDGTVLYRFSTQWLGAISNTKL